MTLTVRNERQQATPRTPFQEFYLTAGAIASIAVRAIGGAIAFSGLRCVVSWAWSTSKVPSPSADMQKSFLLKTFDEVESVLSSTTHNLVIGSMKAGLPHLSLYVEQTKTYMTQLILGLSKTIPAEEKANIQTHVACFNQLLDQIEKMGKNLGTLAPKKTQNLGQSDPANNDLIAPLEKWHQLLRKYPNLMSNNTSANSLPTCPFDISKIFTTYTADFLQHYQNEDLRSCIKSNLIGETLLYLSTLTKFRKDLSSRGESYWVDTRWAKKSASRTSIEGEILHAVRSMSKISENLIDSLLRILSQSFRSENIQTDNNCFKKRQSNPRIVVSGPWGWVPANGSSIDIFSRACAQMLLADPISVIP